MELVGRMFTVMLKLKRWFNMELLLLALTTLNMLTIDTHSISYTHVAIETDGATYHLEEDYSISIEYNEGMINNE